MKKKLKISVMGSAIVIAALILLTAFTSAFPAGQRLLSTEGTSASDTDTTDSRVADKDCDCLERETVICDYLVPGIDAIQSDPEYFDQVCSGRDTSSEEYEARLEAVAEYCASGAYPGSWYGDATGADGYLPLANAILVCVGAGVSVIGIGMILTGVIVTNLAIGMTIIQAIQNAGIPFGEVFNFILNAFFDCIEFLSV